MTSFLHRHWMRLLGRIHHPQALIYGDVPARATIGEGAWIPYGVRLTAQCTVGRYSYVMPSTCLDKVQIGNFCSIAEDLQVISRQHPTNHFSTFPFSKRLAMHGETFPPLFDEDVESGTTRIGHDVWIGTRCIIMGGVKIGTGAIVGAGAVVTHDIPPYAIVGGVPARLIRMRFPQETVNRLMETRWWNWPLKDIRERSGELEAICNHTARENI